LAVEIMYQQLAISSSVLFLIELIIIIAKREQFRKLDCSQQLIIIELLSIALINVIPETCITVDLLTTLLLLHTKSLFFMMITPIFRGSYESTFILFTLIISATFSFLFKTGESLQLECHNVINFRGGVAILVLTLLVSTSLSCTRYWLLISTETLLFGSLLSDIIWQSSWPILQWCILCYSFFTTVFILKISIMKSAVRRSSIKRLHRSFSIIEKVAAATSERPRLDAMALLKASPSPLIMYTQIDTPRVIANRYLQVPNALRPNPRWRRGPGDNKDHEKSRDPPDPISVIVAPKQEIQIHEVTVASSPSSSTPSLLKSPTTKRCSPKSAIMESIVEEPVVDTPMQHKNFDFKQLS
jgi:hypothetical protein